MTLRGVELRLETEGRGDTEGKLSKEESEIGLSLVPSGLLCIAEVCHIYKPSFKKKRSNELCIYTLLIGEHEESGSGGLCSGVLQGVSCFSSSFSLSDDVKSNPLDFLK